ncbi:DUF2987 domain-containing protein [Paraferrimonas haliotis]|uniref:DUF2987 domain-containing protein n=1 Tax=Paraferrimonas haliotis TaxID=2013866 RepID=A0AA37TMU3_9GAMM|nr:DUF2987 domain-containing protein [Paraferrimonas haliotis]GLS84569.1 hypothetical protein GCM10007894_25460 [Paraferrimonas haliotis]
MKAVLALLAMLVPSITFADTIALEYGGFYDRLNSLKKAEVNLIDVKFFVRPAAQDSCEISSLTLINKKHRQSLMVGHDGSLMVPFDRRLKSDRALLEVDVDGTETSCNLAISIQSKPALSSDVSGDWLMSVYQQLDKVYDRFAGFPMRYFRDPLTGVTLHNESDEAIVITGLATVSSIAAHSTLQLSSQQLAQVESLSVVPQHFKITAWF